MEEKKRGTKLAAVLSGLYVAAALVLLLALCGHCFPEVQQRLRQAVTGLEGSPVRQAFGVLADGLEDGQPLRDTMTRTVQVFFDEAD